MRRGVWGLLVLVAAGTLAAGAAAHETTRSYVTLHRTGSVVEADVRVAFRDIEVAVWMDEDLDGRITWGEARRRLEVVDAYLRTGLTLDAGGPCPLERVAEGASTSARIDYLDLTYRASCPSAAGPLTVRSGMFTEIDPDHRMFVQASVGGKATSTILSRSDPLAVFDGSTGGPFASFVSYFRAGGEHLLAGPDHLIFLLTLMLPAVCAAGGPRKAALGVLTAVTGFTLAHALTLTAATTEILRPPTDLINALIALSIVVTAVDNVRPFIPVPRAGLAAFFGIIHGFGFATALGALQLAGGGLATALVGFNLGIEATQVGVVLVCLPALYMLGGGRWLLWIGSAGAGLVGLYWLWIRIAPLVAG